MDERLSSSPILSIVVPMYQEAGGVQKFLSVLTGVLKSVGEPYELILVDDGSTDETWSVIQDAAFHTPCLRAVRLSRNYGKEAAIRAGLDMSKGEAMIVMDGDLQHPPDRIPEMVRLWRTGGVDLIEAIKLRRGRESFVRNALSRSFYSIMNTLSGYDLRQASDFKLMDRKVADALKAMGEKNVFFRGMTAWLGFRSEKISFETEERISGKSAWSFLRLVHLSIVAITGFSSIPLRLVSFLGVVFLMFSIILGVQTLYVWSTGKAIGGFATVILLQLIIGGFLMLALGIIGEYMSKIFQEVKGRPLYIVTDTVDFKRR